MHAFFFLRAADGVRIDEDHLSIKFFSATNESLIKLNINIIQS